mmetsp:Transcript_22595/g.90560  ORF Transcript_22595/g.90560 Transcript_22595/m.90560 type:complete len:154 (-) Transcript_22595:543-1004(-)
MCRIPAVRRGEAAAPTPLDERFQYRSSNSVDIVMLSFWRYTDLMFQLLDPISPLWPCASTEPQHAVLGFSCLESATVLSGSIVAPSNGDRKRVHWIKVFHRTLRYTLRPKFREQLQSFALAKRDSLKLPARTSEETLHELRNRQRARLFDGMI